MESRVLFVWRSESETHFETPLDNQKDAWLRLHAERFASKVFCREISCIIGKKGYLAMFLIKS